MGRRVTIVIDDDLYEKLRKIQAKRIQETGKNAPFSRIINETLAKRIRKK